MLVNKASDAFESHKFNVKSDYSLGNQSYLLLLLLLLLPSQYVPLFDGNHVCRRVFNSLRNNRQFHSLEYTNAFVSYWQLPNIPLVTFYGTFARPTTESHGAALIAVQPDNGHILIVSDPFCLLSVRNLQSDLHTHPTTTVRTTTIITIIMIIPEPPDKSADCPVDSNVNFDLHFLSSLFSLHNNIFTPNWTSISPV